MGPAQIDRADRWFERYGEPVVLFGRMIPLIRAFVSLPAGIARMPLARFSVLSVIGSIPWVLALALAGHALGSEWRTRAQGLRLRRLPDARWLIVAGRLCVVRGGCADAASAGRE